MKKKYKIIFDDESILNLKNIKKISNKNIIINKNIYEIEKNKGIKIFPLKNIEKNFKYIKNLTNGEINHIILNTKTPEATKKIDKIFLKELKNNLEKIIDILKELINTKKKILNVTLIIHKNYKNIKIFWSENQIINKNIKLILKNINKEYCKYIKINFISTERSLFFYNKIYIKKNIKKTYKIEKIINYIDKNKLKNKIIKV